MYQEYVVITKRPGRRVLKEYRGQTKEQALNKYYQAKDKNPDIQYVGQRISKVYTEVFREYGL